MASDPRGLPGLNLLSLDGGGITGLSSLYILREVMVRLQAKAGLQDRPEPHQYFDLIAGTGTGAISAVLIGRLRMGVDDVIRLYNRLVTDTFSDRKWILLGSGMFKATKLEESLKNIVLEATGNAEEMMMEENPHQVECKVVIYAMSAHNINASLPCAFRSYTASTNVMSDCPIWKALRASMAHPELFKSVEIEELGIKHIFIGGGFGCSNPTAQMLKEASALFPDRFVASVTSIGTGHARTIRIPQPSWLERVLPIGKFVTSRVLRAAHGIAIDNEQVANEMRFRFSRSGDIYHRLNVDQGMQGIEASEWEKQNEVASHSRAYMQLPEVDSLLSSLVASILGRRAIFKTVQIDGHVEISIQGRGVTATNVQTNDHIAVQSGIACVGLKHCRHPTHMFRGRKQQLEKASQYFGNEEPKHVFVLHGLGGTGKTQTALQFAELMVERFEGVLFINGSSRDAIEAALGQFALSENIGKGYLDTLQWLQGRRGRWLLLFDNVDDPEVRVHEYFPRANKYDVLITTRHRAVARLARGNDSDCKIDEMDPKDALELLLEAARLRGDALMPEENDAATSLLKEFGYLALAIVQCGAFIYRTQCSIARYYKMYLDEREATLEGDGTPALKLEDYERSVYTTWTLNHTLVGTSSEKLWHLIAFLDRNGTSEELFRRAYENAATYHPQIPPTNLEAEAQQHVMNVLNLFAIDKGTWSSRRFVSAMGELVCLSLITLDTVRNVYQLHPLVQQWARSTIPKSTSIERTSFLLALSINHRRLNEDHAFRRAMVPHVNEILEAHPRPNSNNAWQFVAVYDTIGHLGKKESLENYVMKARIHELGYEHPNTLESIRYAANTHRQRGRLKEAEELHIQVLNSRKNELGEDHPDTLMSKGNLAGTYRDQGRLAEAELLEREVVAARKQALGEDHPDTMQSMENLAVTYREQGRMADAESLEVEVLAARKRVLGEDHPDTLQSMSNLAVTYRNQGRLVETESLELEVVAARKRVLGEDHPDTLQSMGNLAVTYRNLGRLSDAMSLGVEVLAAQKRVLGEHHPDTLWSMGNLAVTYRNQGRLVSAKSLEVKVLTVRKRMLGESHPHTLWVMANLAVTYANQGRLAEAESLEVKVLAARQRVLGENHPHTLQSMTNLAATYKEQGRLAGAESLEVEVVAAMKRVLGKDHPHTLQSIANLAMTYKKRDRLAEAESLEVGVLAARKRVLGEDHPDTLKSMGNLAATYKEQGRLADAESLEVKVVAAMKRALGEDQPDTLVSLANLAVTYAHQGRLADAEFQQVEVVAAMKRVLGEDHPHTMQSIANLAMTYKNQDRLAEAESLEVEVLDARKRVLGEHHLDTLWSMANLAVTYRNRGLLTDAESLQLEVVNARKRILGKDHLDTLASLTYLAVTYAHQDRLADAELLQVEVVTDMKRVLGENHPHTLQNIANLAITYKKQDRLAEAVALEVEVLAARKRVLGEGHPDTLKSMRNLSRTLSAQGRGAEHKALIAEIHAIESR